MGPPEDLIVRLARARTIRHFVETGTYRGRTAAWAAEHFPSVWTIEFSRELYDEARERHRALENVRFRFGDSRRELERIVGGLDTPALFWLDAHWSGGATYGAEDQCPLLEEIAIINRSAEESYILIDDARLFLSPPQPPHRIAQWPDIAAVVDALRAGGREMYIVVIDDVIIAVPAAAKGIVAAYCQEVNAQAWEEYGRQQAASGLRRGLQLICRDIRGRLGRLRPGPRK
ncbi:MAG TPA: hypothetical protein VHI13_03300 [Candidatus Kapabacteria bacterium]|nr:hypothetical protein [Candidatus Kapabacteria bacterium]